MLHMGLCSISVGRVRIKTPKFHYLYYEQTYIYISLVQNKIMRKQLIGTTTLYSSTERILIRH